MTPTACRSRARSSGSADGRCCSAPPTRRSIVSSATSWSRPPWAIPPPSAADVRNDSSGSRREACAPSRRRARRSWRCGRTCPNSRRSEHEFSAAAACRRAPESRRPRRGTAHRRPGRGVRRRPIACVVLAAGDCRRRAHRVPAIRRGAAAAVDRRRAGSCPVSAGHVPQDREPDGEPGGRGRWPQPGDPGDARHHLRAAGVVDRAGGDGSRRRARGRADRDSAHPSVNGLALDVRLAARALLKARSVTFPAVLTLALAIGANAAVFSLVNSLLLRPLPVADPDRLASVTSGFSIDHGFTSGAGWSYRMWESLQQRAAAFDGILAWSPQRFTLGAAGDTEPVTGMLASGEFFSTLGVHPRIGRLFGVDDDRADAPVAVISHRLWMRRFGGAASVVGSPLVVDGAQVTIVGVAPEAFLGLEVGTPFDVALPIGAE